MILLVVKFSKMCGFLSAAETAWYASFTCFSSCNVAADSSDRIANASQGYETVGLSYAFVNSVML